MFTKKVSMDFGFSLDENSLSEKLLSVMGHKALYF